MSVEGFFRNFQTAPDLDNYEKYRMQSAELFLSCDQNKIMARKWVKSDERFFYLTFLNSSYRVFRDTAEVELLDVSEGDYIRAGFNDALVIYDLLAYADPEACPSDEYTQIQNLSGMLTSNTYAGKGMFDEIARRFNGKEKRLEDVLISMGGKRFGKGDVSAKIPLFNDLNAVVSFWSADDEFPASLILFCDKNTKKYLNYETVWYLAGSLFSKIEKSM